MLGPDLNLSITVPEKSLGALSFSDLTADGIQRWVDDLPMANLGETSRQLYKAINELNRCECKPEVRSKILEILRKPIHYACEELSKHFLNSSITPHEKQQKIINLVTSLKLHLATGYKSILVDTVPNLGAEVSRKNFACASHRVITELGGVLLLCSQLYMSLPKGVWKEMNEVFRFADDLGLMKYLVRDESNEYDLDTSIKRAYKRNLLLACCRPNQLRQREIKDAWNLFEIWSNYVEIGRKYVSSSVFCINLADDAPPRHKSLIHDDLNDYFYGFDTAELITRLTSHLSDHSSDVKHIELPVRISVGMLQHLHHSLGILTKRTFKRIASDGNLEIVVGLSGVHFYTSGKTAFQPHVFGLEPISEFGDTPANRKTHSTDPWANAFDAADIHSAPKNASESIIDYTSGPESAEKDFPVHSTALINTSPGGYCIQWPGHIPKSVQAGEILCVRERVGGNWSISVIRWVRHSKQQGTQLGIELLAPRARPCAVQQLNKTGKHSEFLRGLLLPELASIGQPSTLVTPRMPFKQGNKIVLRFNGTETKCVLTDIISETGSFTQFALSTTNTLDAKSAELDEAPVETSSEDEFDSLWPTL